MVPFNKQKLLTEATLAALTGILANSDIINDLSDLDSQAEREDIVNKAVLLAVTVVKKIETEEVEIIRTT